MTKKSSTQSSTVAAFVVALCLAIALTSRADAARNQPGRIDIEYVLPKNTSHNPIYEQIKEARALERIQELLSPLRLPHRLLLKVRGCDGESNAWYEENVINVCYEFSPTS